MLPLDARPALELFVVLAACASIGSGACTRDAAVDAARCATSHRLASNDVQVMSLDAAAGAAGGAPVARPAIACAGLSCLRIEPDVVVAVQPDGALWAAWADEPGRIVSDAAGVVVGEVPKSVTAFAEVVRGRGVAVPSVDVGAPADDIAPLPPGHRTCGSTNAGGGHAYHLIQNEGDIWQGLLWTRQPASAEVKALPPNAYPLAIGRDGALCAWATQKTPRNWQVHSPSGVVVDAAPDREHPPARCISVDVVSVDVGDHPVHVARDGTVTHKEPLPASNAEQVGVPSFDPVLPLLGSSSSNRPAGTLRIADTSFARPLVADMDLAGKPLPAGARRARIASAGDGARFVVVTEKIEQADCTTRELVHLVDTQAPAHASGGAVTTVRDADVVIAKLSAAAGRFWWLEATPQIVDVNN